MHSLLKRQLKRHLGDLSSIPAQWQAFANEVNGAYQEFDADREMLERSLELSSQELVDANSELRAVFQAMPDLVLRLDDRFTVLDIKAGAGSDLIVKREQFVGRRIDDTPLKDVAPKFAEAIVRVIAENTPVNFEYSVALQAQESHYEARLVPLLQDQIVIIIRDITERKSAGRRVQEDLLRLQRAAEAAQAITQHQTLGSMLQEVADQVRAVVGAHQCFVSLLRSDNSPRRSNEVSLSDKYSSWCETASEPGGIVATDVPTWAEADLPIRLTQTEMQAHSSALASATRRDGRPPMRGCLVTALKNRNGETAGLLELSDKYDGGEFTQQDQYVVEELAHIASTAIDNVALIDKIRQLNTELELRVVDRTEALAQQEAIFQAAADQAPQVMWITNTEGAVTYLNRAWYELVGGTSPKWHGHEWTEVVAPADVDEMRVKWKSVRQSGGVFAGIRHVHATDGSVHTLSYRASPVLDARGEITCWIGMDADITEIKAIEAALRLSNRELEAFSYSVSHDLRAPLSTIDGFSKLLATQLNADDPAKVHHYMSRILSSVTQMSQLIESLLALAQIARNTLQPVPVDLSEVAGTVLSQLQSCDPDRHVTVTVEPDLLVRGDAGLLHVLMENLLGNAWKFTSRRSDAEISVGRCSEGDGEPAFFVADNGAGFDMAYADKLFGTFQRLHSAQEFPGTGVGLATVKRVIARHDGRVWAESQAGKGATFFFTLPGAYITGVNGNSAFARKNDSRFGPLL